MMSGRWLRIAPRAQLHAVADDVILPGEDVERVLGLQRLQPALRHREWIVAEVDLLLSPHHIRTSGSRRSSRSRSASCSIRPSCSATRVRARPASLAASASLPAAKKMPSSGPSPIACGEPVHAFAAVVLGDRPAPFAALAGGVAEPGKALAPRPLVHVVEEFAALLGGARRGDGADHHPLLDHPGEQAEARAAEMLADVVRPAADCAGPACRCHI